jgi:hypothetical protein
MSIKCYPRQILNLTVKDKQLLEICFLKIANKGFPKLLLNLRHFELENDITKFGYKIRIVKR